MLLNQDLAAQVVVVVTLSLAVAAISMTIAKGKIFLPLRQWVEDRNEWLGNLVSCPYCTSHWVAVVVVALYQPKLTSFTFGIVDLIVSVFAIVTLSSFFAGLIYRAFTQMAPHTESTE